MGWLGVGRCTDAGARRGDRCDFGFDFRSDFGVGLLRGGELELVVRMKMGAE